MVKVYFEQTGGVIGRTIAMTIDSDSISSQEAKQLEDLIDDTDFFNLPSKLLPSGDEGAADYFSYDITIEKQQLKHKVETTDISMPQSLKPLIRYLRANVQRK
jgi:hypothetical protein